MNTAVCGIVGRSFGVERELEIFWRIDTETPSRHLACFASSTYTAEAWCGGTCTRGSVYTEQKANRPCQLGDPWKAFSAADILAIGHDIVYRYTRCRDHVGGHVYNLPTFLLLVSRVILTLG